MKKISLLAFMSLALASLTASADVADSHISYNLTSFEQGLVAKAKTQGFDMTETYAYRINFNDQDGITNTITLYSKASICVYREKPTKTGDVSTFGCCAKAPQMGSTLNVCN